MEERVRFSDVLVIGGFDMDITASIERNPKSITEYTQILANELCAP
jgi:hypothetical protein